MRTWIALALGLTVLGVAAPAQYWHDSQYLIGGEGSVFLIKANGSVTTMAPNLFRTDDFCMDIDNYHILVACKGPTYPTTLYTGPQYGIYRFDPQTGLHQTLYGPDPLLCWNLACIHVDYNGDYIFATAARATTISPGGWQLMKLDQRGVVSTVLTTLALGRPAYPWGKMTRNIDTGKILLSDAYTRTGPNFLRFPVMELGLDGSVGTWSTGGIWGWDNRWSLPQNHWNGYLEGPLGCNVFRLTPGVSSRSTLGTIFDGNHLISCFHWAYGLDLQTGPHQRWVGGSYPDKFGVTSGWLNYLNPLCKLTSVQLSFTPLITQFNAFAFFRGRHIQTVRMQPHQWSILLSCPRSPGYSYVLGAGVSGVRPAIFAPGFHRINICPDAVLFATVQNRLPGIWKPGPGVLNTSGRARAELDLRSLKLPPGGLGIPLWLAMIVLDPASPGGIKYVPDTYVMRI